ncbi:zinc ABC transporter solute-binding protein [Lactobacillus sp. MRS-253-APC-2B]|uniref:metal ABC transporter solute-binding protein, Zn/Mn family n=1 Tax=Lactobacillus sp. MRS-253-APC-2B TaxID=2725305 RepID=UPI00146D72FB|nr:zinc ABC transporter substrate-binding protein [Lactobacillus sp. MRS-253-APC-2B]MDD6865791.1 zinc ABC transporter substrate-binding protein [Lactobacillus sp.]MDD6893958.1 zinc ABC transporter substrate-binding protein [Lactobacillus sp.]NME34507.1 zinc ABC transporter solute-binding protein [Lactobacillus sp. MRS-253-APC-2B]
MDRRFWKMTAGLGLLLAVILGLAATDWRPQQKSQRPIRVVTSLNFYGEAAQAVAGKYGQVTSVIDNAAIDPHDYQPSTVQAEQVAKANVVILNGLGYDQWMSDLVKANADDSQIIVNVGSQVAKRKNGDNEHVWYRPQTMKKLADQLAKKYASIDPKHKQYYYRNAQKYVRSLGVIDQQIEKCRVLAQKQKVDVSEPVFDYALENLGYQINDRHFEKAIEDGNDPSPQDIQQLQEDIEEHRIAFFVNNKQSDSKTIDNLVALAKKNHVPVLNVTESQPNGKTYRQWMMGQYRQLYQILQRGE